MLSIRFTQRRATIAFVCAALFALAVALPAGAAPKGPAGAPRSAHGPKCSLKPSAHKSVHDEWASCLGVDASLSRAPAVGQTAILRFRVSADVARNARISVSLPANLVFVSGPASLSASDGHASGRAAFSAHESRSFSAVVKAVAPGSGEIAVRAVARTGYGADAGADYVFVTSGRSDAKSALTIRAPRVGQVARVPADVRAVRSSTRPYRAASVERQPLASPSSPSVAQASACVTGGWFYVDGGGVTRPSVNVWVRAWDSNAFPSGDGLLASGVTDGSGHYNLCFDNAETGVWPTNGGTADVYVTFTTENAAWRVGDQATLLNPDFQWSTGVNWDVGGGTLGLGNLQPSDPNLMRGLHAFDAVNDAFFAVPGGQWDQTGGQDQKLILWSPTSTDGTYESGGVVHLAAADPDAPITVDHELGHAIMYDVYEGSFPSAPNCNPHTIQDPYSAGCGWTEGFAEWFPAMVYNDPFFRWPNGASLDLESPTWGSGGWSNGDWPEGRIAGAMIDISDSANEAPWDRRSDGRFGSQWSTFQGNHSDTYAQFAAQGGYTSDTNALASIYGNTIDYGFREPLGNYSPLSRPTPPKQSPIPGGSSNDHRFRYSASTFYWSAVGLRPPAGSDYDLFVYDDNGLGSLLGSSTYGSNVVDFVAVDSNSGRRNVGDDYYPRVYDYAGTGNYDVELAQGSNAALPSRLQAGATKPQVASTGRMHVGSQGISMGSANVLAVRDTFVNAGVPVYVRVVPSNAGQDPELFLLADDPANSATFVRSRGSASASSSSAGPGGAEQLSYNPAVSEWAGLVLVNKAGSGSYSLYVDSSAPSGSVSIAGGASATRLTNVSLALSAADAETGVSQMRISTDGVFDSEPWIPYAASASAVLPSGDGVKTVSVQFMNSAGMVSSASDTILLDTTAPAASMGVLPAFQRATSFVASWSATDGGSGVASYDVQRRSAGPSSAFSAYGNVLSATSATSTSISGPAGQTIGLRIRARDNAGNVSPWAYRVTALPVDDAVASVSGFTKSSGLTGQGYYLDTVSRSTTAGAKLTAPAATQGIKRVGVLVTKGPGFGSIEVRFNGVSLGTFSTANATLAQRQLIVLPPFASAQAGSLQVRVVSPGTRVVVDGLGLLRG